MRSAATSGPSTGGGACRTRTRRRWWTIAGLTAITLLLTLGIMLALYARRLDRSYGDVQQSAGVLQAQVEDAGLEQALSGDELRQLDTNLATLNADMRTLNSQLDTPVLGDIARNVPTLSAKVRASQALLELGITFTSLARDGTTVALDIRGAFERTGFSTDNPTAGPTWLDATRANRERIDDLQRRFEAAVVSRERIDEANLTGRGLGALRTLDALIARASRIRDDYVSLLPVLDTAFGAGQDARYFVLLQNAEEVRQSGGFPGVGALITIRDGRLASIDIQSITELDQAYADRRTMILPAPGPIREYLKQEEWLPHDAIWSADFSQAARQFLAMYAVSRWPELQGVVALNYSAVQDVLRVIGPYEVQVQGDAATISADGIIALIESFRGTNEHKLVVAELGQSLIAKLKEASIGTKKRVWESLTASANRREIQVYMLDPTMQAQVVVRGWDGALEPRPGTPTLAMTIASVAGGKSSTNIYADTTLELEADTGAGGFTRVRWTIQLQHRGDPNGNPRYNGFHRTWLSVYLPRGAELMSSSLTPDPPAVSDDPRALGYNVPILPGEQATLVIEFTLPSPPANVLLRRQSGANDALVRLRGGGFGCVFDESLTLSEDYLLDAATCGANALTR